MAAAVPSVPQRDFKGGPANAGDYGRFEMNRICLVALCSFLLTVITGGGCSKGPPPGVPPTASVAPVVIDPIPVESGVKPLEHQASLLRDSPPVRFTKLFTLLSDAPHSDSGYVEFSRDGKFLAAAAAQPRVDIWDLTERRLVRVLRPPTEGYLIAAHAYLPPGDRIAGVPRSGGKAVLWSVRTGELLATLDSGGRGPGKVAAFPDGKRVVFAFANRAVFGDNYSFP